ncbi:MAG: O-antigen ligase family protein [Chloroflexota bacterium]
MEALDTPRHWQSAREWHRHRESPRDDWGKYATGLLAAILIVYLGLQSGGYDPIPRDQVGIVVWWSLLLGVAVEALPVPGRTRAGLAVLLLLGGFAAWTALSLGWTQSSERTAAELARVVTYLGILALGISAATRRRGGARHVLGGVTLGLALLAALGVLSRLHPAWFPANELGKVLPGIEIERRLVYPIGYSSAMGALAGMTLPLLLAATAWPRRIATQALAAAAIPIVGLTLYLATSGTGAAVAAAALLAFFVLSPDRLPKLITLAAGTVGGAVLAAAVAARGDLARGLPTASAEGQGTEVLWIAIAVCAGVALVQAMVSLAVRRADRPSLLGIERREALIATAVVLALALPVAIAAGAPHQISHRWEVFKGRGNGPGDEPSGPSSILDFHGAGRYQFWQAAVDASKTASWQGIGPGAFEFWWIKHGSYNGYVRTAHSLYLENLAELGIPGLLLIAGFVFAVLGIGTVRSLRAPPGERIVLAGATAGATGFAMAAALDWVWQLGALPAAFMLLAAVAVSGYSLRESRSGKRRRRRRTSRRNRIWAQRAAVAAAAIVAIVAIWSPLQAATAMRQSWVDAARGDLAAALARAHDAAGAEPDAALPRLQEALVLERQGKLAAAAAAAKLATGKEAANWRTWLVLARLEAERGRIDPALRAFDRAHSLNPRYGLLKARG